MAEQRLTDIEVKLAFQEDAIKALGEAVYRQQQTLDSLMETCRRLTDYVRDLAEDRAQDAGRDGGASEERETPPHY